MIGTVAGQLIGMLTGSFNSPVEIFDDSFNTVFSSAEPMRIDVREEQKATDFTIETGETRSDHVVKKPIEITISFMLVHLDARNQFENIRKAKEENEILSIQTKMSSYDSFIIESITHEETASSGVSVDVIFKEWKEIEPEYGDLKQEQVAKPAQSSTVERGKQTGVEETSTAQAGKRSSVARQGLDKIKGWF